MAAPEVQNYCDWCHSPLTDEARRQSRSLGLDREQSWACEACLASGAFKSAPDGWDRSEYPWPARGFEADGADLPRPPEWGLDGVEDVFVFEPGYAPYWVSGHGTVTRDMLLDSAGRLVPLKVWDGVDWVPVTSDWVP